jgi:hypothetical protein
VVKDGAGGYEVVFAGFDFIFEDVELMDFKVRRMQVVDVGGGRCR